MEKGKDLFLSISDQHFPSVVPPQDGNCVVTVRMSNMSLMDHGTHTVWQIVNNWAKHHKKFAVSADEHGALSLLQKALNKRKNITGTGLTSEGAQRQTFAIQRILQLCQSREFKEGEHSMIRHVVFPQPLIPHIEGPFSSFIKTPEMNILKYE
jgi:hypothetical protein